MPASLGATPPAAAEGADAAAGASAGIASQQRAWLASSCVSQPALLLVENRIGSRVPLSGAVLEGTD
jgi:hypothetical protein